MSDMKYLLVKYSLCSLLSKAEKVSETVIVSPKHFRIFLCTISIQAFCLVFCMPWAIAFKIGGRNTWMEIAQKLVATDLSLGCGHREVSSVLFGDYFDDGSSQRHGSARCTASGEFDSCLECMIFCLTVLPALKSNS